MTVLEGDNNNNATDKSNNNDKEKKKNVTKQASTTETLSFVFASGPKTVLIFFCGVLGGIGNGVVFPMIAYLFSTAFTDIAGATQGLKQVRELAYTFMVVGVYALVMATIQTTCFEVVAYRASEKFKLEWFHALTRQDQAFFDCYDISGIASAVTPSANRYRRGLGRKFGEGIQFLTTGVGGLIYSFWVSWRVSLVVLAVCPLICISAVAVVSLNQSKTSRSASAYSDAGSVAYATVSGIKTVLSLNAAPKMIEQYKDATLEAYKIATGVLLKQGFANGSMLGSFLCLYGVLTLFGTYLIYSDVEDTACDPSGAIDLTNNATCENNGPDVFGAMLGVAFAAQGISQVGTFLETFSTARASVYIALQAINRKPGAEEVIIYHELDEEENDNTMSKTSRSLQSVDLETPEGRVKAILPRYEIDSSSDAGKKPKKVKGEITFENVKFHYPTRPGHTILTGLSVDIPAGKTIAFVGPSGGGKSTLVKMFLRYYDPVEGSISLDGTNIKDVNVRHLRSLIGYVGQEPCLFATTIAKNIAYGAPGCTQKQIEEAARQANAHDFIMQLPDGYETQVGDKGSQLSGGQKQRIAIARVLVANPKILLLDEATSALDSQSELVVQEALEKIISSQQRTTVIIAHRLSTIRNADIIAVVMGGVVAETGTHDELMSRETYYKKLVDTQGDAAMMSRSSSVLSKRASTMSSFGPSDSDLGMEGSEFLDNKTSSPLIVFRNVCFSYPTRPNKIILDRFKLKINRGETIALVGTSGGGKSTTIGMIERFYDPDEGSVEYLGVNIKELNVKWYRDQIGYVGQEPTLFNCSIAENIAYSKPDATRDEIEEAARQANAYDFIMNFPDGFDTPVSGGSGTQLSGGQKQRIAIARALVKQPEILVLDEATSALDNESERIVQEALDKLMASKERTIIVIAHRLSTIRNADRIAFISDGRVKEIGSHDELMEKPKGKYKRLVESQGRNASTALHGLETKKKKKKKGKKNDDDEDDGDIDLKKKIEEEELLAFSLSRARKMAAPDAFYLLVGSLGALFAGSIFPMWGLLFAEMIDLLFRPVFECNDEFLEEVGFPSCEEYVDFQAQWMKERSYEVGAFWLIVVCACILGNMMTFWGFGQASERMSKRVRDAAFTSLVRQEVAFFDKRSVGKITSELQDDAARIQTFTGEPVRSFLIAVSSLFTGIVLSFVFMWPFALLALACVPLMGFATSLEMKNFLGEDIGDENGKDETTSPGGIIVETLLNMGTVSALNMEEERYNNFKDALSRTDEHYVKEGFLQGFMAGLSQFVQQWINGLQFWWGGWLLYNYPNQYNFDDFLISNFAILFSLFGLGAAFQDMSDRKETEKSASRIFYLLDRRSAIDPMSEDGKILDTGVDRSVKKKRKSSIKRKKSSKIMESMEEEPSEDIESIEKKAGKAIKKIFAKQTESNVTAAIEDPSKTEKKKKKSSKKMNEGEISAEVDPPKKKKSSVKKKSKPSSEAGDDG